MSEIVFATFLVTLVIFILLAGIVAIILISHRRAENDRRQISKLELDYQKELRTIESEVREETMEHIASELHDNIGQLLTFIKLQLEKEKLRQPDLETRLEPVSDTLSKTITQVRLLSHSLNHEVISDSGLQKAIAKEAERLQSLGRLKVRFESDAVEPSLSRDAKTVAFRLFQEALNNALKHADATELEIRLTGRKGFYLELRDNGKGFDSSLAEIASDGMGLKNMPRRAALAGLNCRVDSNPGEGCIFRVSQ